MLLRNFCEGLKVIYYPFTNIIYIILLFIIAIAITNKLGFNSTIKTTALIFPFIMLSIILLFVGNLKNFSFEKLFPILGDGFKSTFILGLSNIGAFSGISYLYFLPPLLKDPSKFKKISILSIILSDDFSLLEYCKRPIYNDKDLMINIIPKTKTSKAMVRTILENLNSKLIKDKDILALL